MSLSRKSNKVMLERPNAFAYLNEYDVWPSKLLYHYTNTSGLLGILSSSSIHLSKLGFSNDHAERLYAFDIFERAFGKRFSGNKELMKFKEELSVFFRSGFLDPYVICFSEEPDDLSQWRAYCSGVQGYSIGFNFNQVRFDTSAEYLPRFIFLVKVRYDESEQTKLVAQIVNRIEEWFSQTDQKFLESPCKEIYPDLGSWNLPYTTVREYAAEQFGAQLQGLGLLVKHRKFESEKEWRLVLVRPQYPLNMMPPEFKASVLGVTPYCSVGLSEVVRNATQSKVVSLHAAIEEIWQSPRHEPLIGLEALRMLKRRFGNILADTKMIESEIPLRF